MILGKGTARYVILIDLKRRVFRSICLFLAVQYSGWYRNLKRIAVGSGNIPEFICVDYVLLIFELRVFQSIFNTCGSFCNVRSCVYVSTEVRVHEVRPDFVYIQKQLHYCIYLEPPETPLCHF